MNGPTSPDTVAEELFTDVFGLSGKVAVVTGGSSGIGEFAGATLARAGARVVLVARSPDRLHRCAADLAAQGLQVEAVAADVTDPEAVEALSRRVHADHGAIDVLVNSAGVYSTGASITLGLDEWRRVMEVNATGTLIPCQVIGRSMIQRGSGKIVNIASPSSVLGLPEAAAYTASKGALLQLTRTLGVEWIRHGVNVNAIGPCDFRTPMMSEVLDTPEYQDWIEQAIPVGRPGELHELRGALLLLCSSASDMIVGHCLMVDGGRTVI